MFKTPDLVVRKQHTKYIIEKYQTYIQKLFTETNFQIYATYFLHGIIVFLPFYILLFKSLNIYFYISLIVWVIIIFLHLYFNGCIFIRIERELTKNKKWKGIWTYLFDFLEFIGITVTDKLANNIFICWGIIFSLFIFLKIFFLT
jgi:hypothetical protein